ncbi:asparagine synthase C-terminal domain-containing protein [Burkholderia territorii]|uniref:asparagine synthase-related protein n=1 Tax=Burkholderia territorii TaxID=1503055 RepID=UPI0009BD77CA|nr:asparagine synthase C-terminal domain-containing protein [Burkholderia territorii]
MVNATLFNHSSQCDSTELAEGRFWRTACRYLARFKPSSQVTNPPLVFGENSIALWCIAGRVLSRDSGNAAPQDDFVATVLQDISEAASQFWGPFAAVVFDRRNSTFIVLCDSCGQFPIYYSLDRSGDLHIASVANDLPPIEQGHAKPNNSYLHCYLAHGYGNADETGIENVSLLAPGMFLTYQKGDISLSRMWAPNVRRRRSVDRSPISILSSVLHSLIEPDRPAVLELSGGLESTALAIAAHRAGLSEQITAVTHFDPDRASSNEVSIARAVAEKCRLRHETYPLLSQLPFAPVHEVPLTARPSTQLCFLAQTANLAHAGVPGRYDTLINGHGGDALFLAPPPFGVSVDAMANLRFVRAITALRDLAIYYRMPIWVALKRSMHDARQYFRGGLGQSADPSVVHECPMTMPAGLYDDLLNNWRLLIRPGRRYQMAALAATLDETAIQVRPTIRRPILPFLAQPMVELALGASLEDLFTGYHNRLIVRQAAFDSSNLPNLWRTDKGDTTHSVLQGLYVHYDHVREVCLNGFCVAERMVRRDGLEKLLKRAADGFPVGLAEITRIYATETFVRGMFSGRKAIDAAHRGIARTVQTLQ